MAKRSFDPQLACPEVKVQVRDLVRVVGIVAPFAPRGRGAVFREIRFIGYQEKNGSSRPVPGALSSGTPRESQAKIRNRTV